MNGSASNGAGEIGSRWRGAIEVLSLNAMHNDPHKLVCLLGCKAIMTVDASVSDPASDVQRPTGVGTAFRECDGQATEATSGMSRL